MRSGLVLPLSLFLAANLFAAGRDLSQPSYGPMNVYDVPSVATAGNGFLTIWSANGVVFGSRADADGRLLTPVPLRIAESPGPATLASTGDHYIVLTNEPVSGSLLLLDQVGTVIESRPAPPVGPLLAPQMAANSAQICIIDNSSRVEATVLRPDGSPVLSRIPAAPKAWDVSLACATRDCTIATAESTGIYVRTVSPEGAIGNPLRISERTDTMTANKVAVATNGNETLVLWADIRAGVSCALVKDGALVASHLLESSTRNVARIALAWTGTDYFALVYGETSFAVRLDRSGNAIEMVSVSVPVDSIAMAADIAYVAGRASTIVGTAFRLSGGITEVRSEVLSIGPREQRNPAVAGDGANFLAVWNEDGIVAERIGADGAPLAAGVFSVGASGGRDPVVAFGGDTYLVAWCVHSNVVARRFHSDGTPIDSSPITITRGDTKTAVAWNGSSFLLVWSGGQYSGTMGCLLGTSGPPGESHEIMQPWFEPDVAWNGREFLVIGGEGDFSCGAPITCPYAHGATYGIRVGAGGLPLQDEPVLIDPRAETPGLDAAFARVASDGDGFAVVVARNDLLLYRISTDSDLRIDSKSTLFRWFSPIQVSIAAADGSVAVAWSYAAPNAGKAWLSTARFGDAAIASPSRAVPIRGGGFWAPRLSLAADDSGGSLTVIEEWRDSTVVVRDYVDSEMPLAPAPPPSPVNPVALRHGTSVIVRWAAVSFDTEGLELERPFHEWLSPGGTASADAKEITIGNALTLEWIGVRAFNAGGLSDLVRVPVTYAIRRRSSR